jgi:hypothetical protein
MRFEKYLKFFLLFLVIPLLLMKMLKVKIQVKNVPTPMLKAMEKALANSPYKKHLTNWLAVSKMETDGWKSTVFTMLNNPWGMRPSVKRKNTQIGAFNTQKNGAFARYKNLDDAAADIVLYMQDWKWPTEEMDLFSFISLMKSKGYFVEPVDYYYKAVMAQLNR